MGRLHLLSKHMELILVPKVKAELPGAVTSSRCCGSGISGEGMGALPPPPDLALCISSVWFAPGLYPL